MCDRLFCDPTYLYSQHYANTLVRINSWFISHPGCLLPTPTGCWRVQEGEWQAKLQVNKKTRLGLTSNNQLASTVVRTIGAALENRHICTAVNDIRLVARIVRSYQQGGVLSPLLRLVVVEDLLVELKFHGIHGYAVDVCIVGKGRFPQSVVDIV